MAKRSRIMSIEYKGYGLVGSARIGRVTYSKTGSSLYYEGKAFQSLSESALIRASPSLSPPKLIVRSR
jgi:hypothetical protein